VTTSVDQNHLHSATQGDLAVEQRPITDTDSVRCTLEDCAILQSLWNTAIPPPRQLRLWGLLHEHTCYYILTLLTYETAIEDWNFCQDILHSYFTFVAWWLVRHEPPKNICPDLRLKWNTVQRIVNQRN